MSKKIPHVVPFAVTDEQMEEIKKVCARTPGTFGHTSDRYRDDLDMSMPGWVSELDKIVAQELNDPNMKLTAQEIFDRIIDKDNKGGRSLHNEVARIKSVTDRLSDSSYYAYTQTRIINKLTLMLRDYTSRSDLNPTREIKSRIGFRDVNAKRLHEAIYPAYLDTVKYLGWIAEARLVRELTRVFATSPRDRKRLLNEIIDEASELIDLCEKHGIDITDCEAVPDTLALGVDPDFPLTSAKTAAPGANPDAPITPSKGTRYE